MSGTVVYPMGVTPPVQLTNILDVLNEQLRSGRLKTAMTTISTGFPLLDRLLGGGFNPQDLVLVGGIQGVGKTTMVLQIAAHMAQNGAHVIFVCYEHAPLHLLYRLMCLESARDGSPGWGWADLRERLVSVSGQGIDGFWRDSRMTEVLYRLGSYSNNLWMPGGNPTLDVLEKFVLDVDGRVGPPVVLIVDYIQIVPVRPDPLGYFPRTLEDKMDRVMEELKRIALRYDAVVIGVAAGDKASLQQNEVHVEDFAGSPLVSYQPDTVITLNRGGMDEKSGITSVRVAIEKQRVGPQGIEMLFRLDGRHFLMQDIEIVPWDQSLQRKRLASDLALTAKAYHAVQPEAST